MTYPETMRLSDKPIKGTDLSKKLAPFAPAYFKPKILLLDVVGSAHGALVDKGFNVRKGSFGKPYKVPKSGAFQPVTGVADLSNFTEQEVVVIDLHVQTYDTGPKGEKHRPRSEVDPDKQVWMGPLSHRAQLL